MRTEIQTFLTSLEKLGPQRVWRSITDGAGTIVFSRICEMEDGLADPSGIDFKDQAVADLGCNMGKQLWSKEC